jgi:hypothetical protein
MEACMNDTIRFQLLNLTLTTGTQSKIEYFEVANSEKYTNEALLAEIKNFGSSNIATDTLEKYSEVEQYYYRRSVRVNYNSYAGKNTSNFEEGGIRDWDNPRLYNMDKNLLARISYEGSEMTYALYKNGVVDFEKIEKRKH